MAQTILISGGAGFVGRNLLFALLKANPAANIWLIDDLSIGKLPEHWELHRAVLHQDLTWGREYCLPGIGERTFTFVRANFAAVVGAELGMFPKLELPELPVFDEVYHLASIVGGRQTIEGKPLLVGTDLAIDSLFFLWAASTKKAKRILYASSSAAYPTQEQTFSHFSTLSEELIDFDRGLLAPDMTYGWSKLTGEYLAQIAVKKHGLKVGIVRPFSGYGEDQDPSYPVPAIALRVAAHQNPVRVWGSGQQGRDFVHIDDCVDGIIQTCRKIDDASAVNLGSGLLTSFLDLARLMVRLEGYEATVNGTDNRPVGVANRVGAPQRAKVLLGWSPTISVADGMARVLQHARSRLRHGYKPEL